MNTAWARGSQAYTEPASVLGIRTGGKSRRLFVPYLNKSDLLLARSQGLKEAIDTIPRESEMVSTLQSMSRSITRSATVFAMGYSPDLVAAHSRESKVFYIVVY